jgi:hypothetical protein
MTRKNIIHTLALAEHARNISALRPEFAGFYAEFITTLPPTHQRLVSDYRAAFADIAKSGVEYFEKAKPSDISAH